MSGKKSHLEFNLRSRRKGLRAIYTLGIVVCFAVFVFSCYKLTSGLLEHKKAADSYSNIKKTAVSAPVTEGDRQYLSVDWDTLAKINGDYMGWLDIPGTKISYPVVYADDYDEYLRTTFEKKPNLAGSIFSDFDCASDWSSKNTILYGHRLNDGSMFGTLEKYRDESFFSEHREIHVYAENCILTYEVFSVFNAIAGDENYRVNFDGEADYEQWLSGVKGRSLYDTRTYANPSSKILMLSTCMGGENESRTVIFAVQKEIIDR
ncbi:MAG: class B sortase [Oscillospiraceae bacterium]